MSKRNKHEVSTGVSGVHTSVETENSKPSAQVGVLGNRWQILTSRILKFGVLGALVVGILWAGWSFGLKKVQNHANGPKCSDEVLRSTTSKLDATKISQIKPVISQIQGIQGYDQDPNCLYVLVLGYVYSYDVPNAQLNLKKLVKVYDPKKGFNKNLGTKTYTLAQLDNKISSLDKAMKQADKNRRILNGL